MSLLALAPRRLRHLVCIAALIDDASYMLGEATPDLFQHWSPALVLHGIVEETCNGQILIRRLVGARHTRTDGLPHERRDRQEMRDVGNPGTVVRAFAEVSCMQPCCVGECLPIEGV